MTESNLWWLLAGAVVVLELLSGTFYMLMLALGLAAGAISAHLGASLSAQIVVAALVGSTAVLLLFRRKARSPRNLGAQTDRNVNLDIGEIVEINHWQADGTADVQYRGARWTAIHRPNLLPSPGKHRIAELQGSRLLVDKI